MTPPPPPATPTAPPAPAGLARRRFRSSDVALHLDMVVVGDLCVAVGLAGYRSVLASFLGDESGSQAALLAALLGSDRAALPARAHAVKGAAASLGLRSVQAAALRLEADGASLSAEACAATTTELRELLDTTRALLQRMGFI